MKYLNRATRTNQRNAKIQASNNPCIEVIDLDVVDDEVVKITKLEGKQAEEEVDVVGFSDEDVILEQNTSNANSNLDSIIEFEEEYKFDSTTAPPQPSDNKTSARPLRASKISFSCKYCKLSFTYENDLQEHLKNHKSHYNCGHCKRMFFGKIAYLRHVKVHYRRKFPCNQCNKIFTCSSNLKIHTRTHTGEQPYECKRCSRKFSQLSSYYRHKRTTGACQLFTEKFNYAQESSFECKVCHRSFSSKSLFCKHVITHKNDINGLCKYCETKFSSSTELQNHLKTHHSSKLTFKENPLNCEICNLEFEQESLLNDHNHLIHGIESAQNGNENIHDQSKDAIGCKFCEARFSNKIQLHEHLQIRHFERKIYKCWKCCQIFYCPSDLSKHFRIHTGEKPFLCAICKRTFNQTSSLYRHMQLHKNKTFREFGCDHCEKKFASKDVLINHLSLHNLSEGRHCPDCKTYFSNESTLLAHIKTHNAEKDDTRPKTTASEKGYSCNVCNITFPKRSLLVPHVMIHLLKNPLFACTICQKTFSEGSDLIAHQELHASKSEIEEVLISDDDEISEDPMPILQPAPQATVTTTSDEINEELSEEMLPPALEAFPTEGNVTCDEFSEEKYLSPSEDFPTESNINNSNLMGIKLSSAVEMIEDHDVEEIYDDNSDLISQNSFLSVNAPKIVAEEISENEHPVGDSLRALRYHCEICRASYVRKDSLVTHKKNFHNIYESTDAYQCIYCDMKFSIKKTFDDHTKTHKSNDSYYCKYCNKSFSRYSYLLIHNRVHTGDKPYKCLNCDTSFRSYSTLVAHSRRHTGERPYRCETCFKTFTQSSSLNSHFRKHTQEKPYECTICDKKFTFLGSYNDHLKTHNQTPSKCKICGHKFKIDSYLKRHMRQAHRHYVEASEKNSE